MTPPHTPPTSRRRGHRHAAVPSLRTDKVRTVTSEATYQGDDFYCDVAIPRTVPLDVVHDDERVLAYHHTRPYWDVHLVVVPKRHIGSLTTVRPSDEADVRALLCVVQDIARAVEKEHGAAAVLTNLGAYQDSKHLHIHVHSGPRRST